MPLDDGVIDPVPAVSLALAVLLADGVVAAPPTPAPGVCPATGVARAPEAAPCWISPQATGTVGSKVPFTTMPCRTTTSFVRVSAWPLDGVVAAPGVEAAPGGDTAPGGEDPAGGVTAEVVPGVGVPDEVIPDDGVVVVPDGVVPLADGVPDGLLLTLAFWNTFAYRICPLPVATGNCCCVSAMTAGPYEV